MKIFVWEDLEHVSGNYHEGGGLVVIAPSLEEAISLAGKDGATATGEPAFASECETEVARVFIFPNAGCW